MTPSGSMGPLPDRRVSELQRQRVRLATDLPSRIIGVTLTCLLFAFALPTATVGGIYILCIVSEYLYARQTRSYLAHPTPATYRLLLAFSGLGMTAFCLLPLLARHHPSPLVQFAGVLALMGALLNVSMIRSSHLLTGLVNGAPPALVLLWYPGQSLLDPTVVSYAPFALAGVMVLVGYFASALVRNHRQDAELADALDRANAASEAKSRFLSTMSHEMRTPLNAILGLAQVIREGADLRHARRLGQEIEQAGRTLEALLEDVLELAAAAGSEIEYRPVTAALQTELEAAVRAASITHGRDDLSVSVHCAPDLPEIARFDPLILRRTLTGLAGIVCAGSAGGGAVLRLDCTCGGAAGDRLRLRLACESGGGPGDPAGPPKEGRPVQPGTLAEDPAESLAMTLVQRLIGAAGGSAWLEPGAGGQTVALLDLPVTPAPPLPVAGAGGPALRALVVDDIGTNRFVVVQMLRSLGIEATEAESGSAAIDKLGSGRFDVVLLDMAMPGMDGEATFRAIRSSEADGHHVPVIALTANALSERRSAYLALGLDGYVAKPVDRRILWSEIQGAVAETAP